MNSADILGYLHDSGVVRGAIALGLFVAGLVALQLVVGLALKGIRWVAARSEIGWDDRLHADVSGPLRVLLTVFSGWPLLRALDAPPVLEAVLERCLGLTLVFGFAWFFLRLASLAGRFIERRTERSLEGSTNAEGRVRGVKTQVVVFRRITSIVVGVLATALALVQFESVRTVGFSLLASAGVLGVVLGLAAQKPVAAILAGIQLAVTSPVRIGDTVMVEGELGTVEEINLTHIVVKIWDQRRLVVPMTRFLDQPFQNWTKKSTALLGTVLLQADHRISVDAVRAELERILVDHPQWDGRKKSVQVTNTSERSIEIRALLSAANADNLWDLRCDVREKLVAWLAVYDGGRYLPILAPLALPTASTTGSTTASTPSVAASTTPATPGTPRSA